MNITVSVQRRPDGGRKGRNGSAITLLGPQTVSVPTNAPSIHHAAPAIGDYSFAFWWVGGSGIGDFVTLSNPVTIPPGTTDMVAKCWFTRTAVTPPPGTTALFVDAFDVGTGSFIDDDFVTVKDADQQVNSAITLEANNNMVVSTAALQLVEASTYVGARTHDRWECLRGQETIMGTHITASQGGDAEAVAFYSTKYSSGLRYLDKFFAAQTWVSYGVTVDGGGPTGGGPVPPWDPLLPGVAAGLALAQVAAKLNPALRGEALKLAARQVSLAAADIGKALDAAADAALKKK